MPTYLSAKSFSIPRFIGLILGGVVLLNLSDVDDRVQYWWSEWRTSEIQKKNSIWLPEYRADIQGREVVGVEKNLSGITYNPDTNTLWVIVNSPQKLVELSPDLETLRTIRLENFRDTEAIAYVASNVFLIADEKDQSVSMATIDQDTLFLDRDALPRVALSLGSKLNRGLEGLAVDPRNKEIFMVKEKDPLFLTVLSGFFERYQIDLSSPASIDLSKAYLDDLSGLHFDESTGHLLVLSHEAKLLAEIDMNGNKVSFMDLEESFNGLVEDIPQAEGVTLDGQGRLYIVSEPNLVYRFSRH